MVEQVPLAAPWYWLASGFRDMVATRFISLIYGACFIGMGVGIEQAHSTNRIFALSLVAGFLFVGPFLAVGLYEFSRQLQNEEPVDLLISLFCWCRNPRGIGRFALLLSVMLGSWLWLSVWFFDAPLGFSVNSEDLLVSIVIVTIRSAALWMWLCLLVWVPLAVLVFMASVVSVPMLLDRPVSMTHAIRLSVESCVTNPSRSALAVAGMSDLILGR